MNAVAQIHRSLTSSPDGETGLREKRLKLAAKQITRLSTPSKNAESHEQWREAQPTDRSVIRMAKGLGRQ
jgi:hypothetical protein